MPQMVEDPPSAHAGSAMKKQKNTRILSLFRLALYPNCSAMDNYFSTLTARQHTKSMVRTNVLCNGIEAASESHNNACERGSCLCLRYNFVDPYFIIVARAHTRHILHSVVEKFAS